MSEERVLKSPPLDKNILLLDAPVISVPPLEEKKEAERGSQTEESILEELDVDGSKTPDLDTTDEELETEAPDAEHARPEDFSTLEDQAQEIITAAQERAEELITEAHQGIEVEKEALMAEIEEKRVKAEEEGYQIGFRQGLSEGEKKAEEEYAQKLQEVESRLKEAEELNLEATQEKERILKEAKEERIVRILQSEEEILKLAFEIAEKIIRKQFLRSPEDWLLMVKEATQRVAGARELTVRVSPQDEAFLQEHRQEIQRILSEAPQLKIIADPSLEDGDLVLQSDLGQIDARIKQQLNKMLQSLKEEERE